MPTAPPMFARAEREMRPPGVWANTISFKLIIALGAADTTRLGTRFGSLFSETPSFGISSGESPFIKYDYEQFNRQQKSNTKQQFKYVTEATLCVVMLS